LKIVLIVLAVVVGLGVVSVGAAMYIGYRALHASGNSFLVGKSVQLSNSDLGVAIYPGAAAKEGVGAKVKIGSTTMVSATYTTGDPVSSVVSFYQSKIGGQAIVNKNVNGTSFESVTTNGGAKETIVVTIAPTATDGSVTQIVILHTTSSAAATPATQ
jgi:hypothetical protein